MVRWVSSLDPTGAERMVLQTGRRLPRDEGSPAVSVTCVRGVVTVQHRLHSIGRLGNLIIGHRERILTDILDEPQ